METIRLKSQEDRLAFIQRQIALCSIRAPHDGIAVIVKRGWRWEPLQPGVRVNQGQSLFTLPDPSRMEVEVSIHETVGAQVKQGMRADVRIASMADKLFPGRIASIIPMPIRNDKEWDERLRHFLARVRLDDVPSGILPLMSAEVQIDAGKMTEALVIPAEAVSLVNGQPACYVMAENGMERRTVKTGRSTVELLEVISGLDEGEHVAARFDSVPVAIP